MLPKSFQTTLHRKKSCSILSSYSWNNIAEGNTLDNIALEAPDNIAQEKILFIVVLILLGQHCAGKRLVQCFPRTFWQHCTENILLNIVLILLGKYCIGKNLVQYSPKGSRQHCTRKILFNVVLILLGQHCTGKNPLKYCPRDSTQHCIEKKP